MITDLGFAVYSEMLTRTREAQLKKLKRENAALRAQLALVQFWKVYHTKYALKDGVIVIS